jgi:hypothetical protein
MVKRFDFFLHARSPWQLHSAALVWFVVLFWLKPYHRVLLKITGVNVDWLQVIKCNRSQRLRRRRGAGAPRVRPQPPGLPPPPQGRVQSEGHIQESARQNHPRQVWREEGAARGRGVTGQEEGRDKEGGAGGEGGGAAGLCGGGGGGGGGGWRADKK